MKVIFFYYLLSKVNNTFFIISFQNNYIKPACLYLLTYLSHKY